MVVGLVGRANVTGRLECVVVDLVVGANVRECGVRGRWRWHQWFSRVRDDPSRCVGADALG